MLRILRAAPLPPLPPTHVSPSPPCLAAAVLAIGGVGGLAVGLAGREILENLFTGLIIMSSNPFEVSQCTHLGSGMLLLLCWSIQESLECASLYSALLSS